MPDKLIDLFADCLELSPETLDDNTSPDNTSEWDSLAAMDLIAVIEETFDCRLSTGDIMKMRTIGIAREVLRGKGIKEF